MAKDKEELERIAAWEKLTNADFKGIIEWIGPTW